MLLMFSVIGFPFTLPLPAGNVQCCNVLPTIHVFAHSAMQGQGPVKLPWCPLTARGQSFLNLRQMLRTLSRVVRTAGLAAHYTRCRRLSTQKFVNAIITWYNSVINGGEIQKWENGMWHLFNFSSGKCNANNNLRESLQIDLQFPRPKSTNLGCKRISKYLEASHHLQY